MYIVYICIKFRINYFIQKKKQHNKLLISLNLS